MKRYAIYGAGSLGTVLGAYITKNGGKIDLINRNIAHVEALRKNGAKINGTVELTVPVTALTPDEMQYTVKGYDGVERIMPVRRHAFNINKYAQRYVRVGNILSYPDIKHGYVLDAECWLIDTRKLWELGYKRMMEDNFYFVDKM